MRRAGLCRSGVQGPRPGRAGGEGPGPVWCWAAALPSPRPAAGPTFVSNLPERSGGASRCRLAARRRTEARWLPRGLAQARPCTAEPRPVRAGAGEGGGAGAERAGSLAGPLAGPGRGKPLLELTLGVHQAGFSLEINNPFRAFCYLFPLQRWVCVLLGSFSQDLSVLLVENGGCGSGLRVPPPRANPAGVMMWLGRIWRHHPSAVAGLTLLPLPSPALQPPGQS